MKTLKVIVMGASAGGIEALNQLFRKIEPNPNAAFFVVVHLNPEARSLLPQILGRHSSIPVESAQNGQVIEAGHAYIAPPDRHLILKDGSMRLEFGPKVNFARPAIDPLFESAAQEYGPDAIGVILSGLLSDGAKGLLTIKHAGGIAVVQDLDEALFPDMPATALKYVPVDHVLPVADIASLLNSLAEENFPEKGESRMNQPVPDFSEDEVKLIQEEFESYEKGYESNQRSVLTCPDCGGVLWELRDGQLVQYRCHTGHIYNAESLLTGYDENFEKAFWMAIRVMVEKSAICNRLAVNAQEHGDAGRAAYFLSMAREAEEEVKRVRATWLKGKTTSSKDESAGEQVNDDITHSEE